MVGLRMILPEGRRMRPISRRRRAVRVATLSAASAFSAASWLIAPTIHAATQDWVPTTAGPFGYNDSSNWNAGAGPAPGDHDTANMFVDLTSDQSVRVTSPVGVHEIDLGDTAQTGGVFNSM